MKTSKKFKLDADRIAFDLKHRNTIKFNIDKYKAAHQRGNKNYQNKSLARNRAAFLKRSVLENWSKYLIEFETNFKNNGGTVHWARDAKEAIGEVEHILRKHNPPYVMKSKSMVSEEILLNEALEEFKVEPIETDLGEFIVQLAGEKPYHILTPAMHKSKEDVADLFQKHFSTAKDATPEEITKFVRNRLRKKFLTLKVGITGANFLIADTGSVALTENEGNGIMTTAFPNVHIIITGIEKVIPSINNLATFWPLLANAGTGQKLTVYNSLFTGNKNKSESQGPKEVHIILLDNGRTNLYKTKNQFDALACIRCGACLNACPIYKNIGGYTYNTVYSGPIGSVITPHLRKGQHFDHLSFACTLCGKCKEVCPVKIDLPELLLLNRKKSVEDGETTRVSQQGMKLAKSWLIHRQFMNLPWAGIKNLGAALLNNSIWGNKRFLPKFKSLSFSQQYKKKQLRSNL